MCHNGLQITTSTVGLDNMETYNFFSIRRIAELADGNYNLVRRYTKRFPELFKGKVLNGVQQYPAESVEIVKRIRSLYKAGRKRVEIKEILRSEYSLEAGSRRQEKFDIPPTLQPRSTIRENDMIPVLEDLIEELSPTRDLMMNTTPKLEKNMFDGVKDLFSNLVGASRVMADQQEKINELHKKLEFKSTENQNLRKKIEELEKKLRVTPDPDNG